MRALRDGAPADECFAVLDARLRPRLLAYFRSDASAGSDAEDLTQSTMARVLKGIGGLRAEESFFAWLFTIARNVRRTAHGRRQRAPRLVTGGMEAAADTRDPRPTPLEDGLEQERLATVQAAIDALPRQQRQCFLLRVEGELSYEDVAATLSLSVHTVRNHLALARKSLRKVLGVSDEEEP